MVFMAKSKAKWPKILDKSVVESEERGLTLNYKKTITGVFSRKQVKPVCKLQVKDEIIKQKDQFFYFGEILTCDGKIIWSRNKKTNRNGKIMQLQDKTFA